MRKTRYTIFARGVNGEGQVCVCVGGGGGGWNIVE